MENYRIIMNLPGATTEVATLKQALSEAENKAAKERTEREKQGTGGRGAARAPGSREKTREFGA